jgi:hypothetical protein
MNLINKIIRFFILALIPALIITACGGGGNSNNGGSSTVPVTAVSLLTSTSISVNDTEQLVATITPANATNKNLIWKSSDNTKATVSENGIVKGVHVGSSVITVTSEDGDFTDSCYITVDFISVIDVSNTGTCTSAYTFGYKADDQAKRFQTFIADSHTKLDGVEVKIRKNDGSQTYNNISVELYDMKAGLPSARIAETTINPSLLGTDFAVLRAELEYQGLISGTEYAVILGQVNLDGTTAGIEWCTKEVNSELNFGKLEGSTWIDESGLGDGWLKVYVSGAYIWSALGTGMGGELPNVYSLVSDPFGTLYAGGYFSTAGGTTVNNIAKWNRTAWSSPGGVDSGAVSALAFDSYGNLYAGGNFITMGGTTVNNIAKWDGTTWSALDTGVDPGVNAITFDSKGNVYAGGMFTTAGGNTVNCVAKWDGTSWSALGTGMGVTYPQVYALAVDSSDNLYAGGDFTTAGGTTVNYIAKWDGTSWSALGSGMDNTVTAIVFDSSGNLYAGGLFYKAGGTVVKYIAKWDGASWSVLGKGMDSNIYSLAIDSSDNLYAGGNFTTAGDTAANYIAMWNGISWSALGAGLGGTTYPYVFALAIDSSDNLYAGGSFVNAGGVTVNSIARWGH